MLKQIRYYQVVVRCGSFTVAAEECYISQSAISQQIQALEQELGVKLPERSNRKFTLTPAGEHFYEKSLILTADFDRLLTETIRIAHRESPSCAWAASKATAAGSFSRLWRSSRSGTRRQPSTLSTRSCMRSSSAAG